MGNPSQKPSRPNAPNCSARLSLSVVAPQPRGKRDGARAYLLHERIVALRRRGDRVYRAGPDMHWLNGEIVGTAKLLAMMTTRLAAPMPPATATEKG